jgi:phosphoglycolate phosphatase
VEVASTGLVLFDFDGPICDLFAGHGSDEVLAAVREALPGFARLPFRLRRETNAHSLLRAASIRGLDQVEKANRVLSDHERMAAAVARPTPGARQLMELLAGRGIPMAVASNNSGEAIESYLELHGLTPFLGGHVHGRAPDPDLMKPDPHCLHRAIEGHEFAGRALLLGDSPSDALAARRAGADFVGCVHPSGASAARRRRASPVRRLRAAGARFVLSYRRNDPVVKAAVAKFTTGEPFSVTDSYRA